MVTSSLQEMRYLPGRRVAHIVRPTFPSSSRLASYCGRSADGRWWLGGGINGARRIATLPMCKSCKKASQS